MDIKRPDNVAKVAHFEFVGSKLAFWLLLTIMDEKTENCPFQQRKIR